MATEVDCGMEYFVRPWECPKGDPPVPVPQPYHSVFVKSTHASLQAVTGAELLSSGPALIKVSVLNASNTRMVQMDLDKSDTVGKLKEKFLQQCPDHSGNLNLACNGKPVLESQTLNELNLKESALFVTYQRCVGG
ncbi:hypothetical protein ANANG_G00096950 [Anguilla anguilla]|uniref:Ubiquitin-like domain-containing protein n=1 Tax=Anguilla anguilla TaxID=7936 RepID=A0A9D3S2X7_ANGAN|nr:hypothetical protein ANANG_G00096950 [Anguilla anguilla]